jgi:hypothetical protein
VGVAADSLIERQVFSVTTVRQLAQSTAFLVPAVCNVALAVLTPRDQNELLQVKPTNPHNELITQTDSWAKECRSHGVPIGLLDV